MADQNLAIKVGEIFTAAGEAFSKLAELTMQLNTQVEAPPGSKWTEEEINMLKKAVSQFGTDLHKISEVVKTRSIGQLKNAIKRKIYEDAGVAVKSQPHAVKGRTITGSSNVETLTAETVSFDDFTNSLDGPSGAKKMRINSGSGGTSNGLLDVENLDDSSSSFKKLDKYISSRPSVESRTVGGITERSVSNPPPLPPLDLVSDPS